MPPGPHGGNIDINLLTVGATLYLPVQVDGALAYVGDPHFAQGDGEVSLTAMEASLRATVRLDVVPREDAVRRFGELAGPLAETTDHLVPTGMDEDLDVAVQNCVRAAIALLEARYGMDPRLAYAYLSAATDFDISQVVDVVKGVHARIRKSDFARARDPAAVPDGLVEAFWEYERALMSDDVPRSTGSSRPADHAARRRQRAAGRARQISAFRGCAAARRSGGSCRRTCRPSTTTTRSWWR